MLDIFLIELKISALTDRLQSWYFRSSFESINHQIALSDTPYNLVGRI
jgi:hypothetical protein